MRRPVAAAAVAACLALPGTALALFDDDVARAQIQELRRQVEAAAKLVDERLTKSEDRRALIEVAARLTAAVRHVDTVARIGGDEFALLIHPTDAAGAELSAQRILSALQKPFCIDEESFSLTASLGIAMHLWPNDQPEELMQSADAAMRQVKHQGGNRYGLHAATQTLPGASWH